LQNIFFEDNLVDNYAFKNCLPVDGCAHLSTVRLDNSLRQYPYIQGCQDAVPLQMVNNSGEFGLSTLSTVPITITNPLKQIKLKDNGFLTGKIGYNEMRRRKNSRGGIFHRQDCKRNIV
jgi:hypothetical protein